jgi:ParB family chromosome partitioning protein
MSEQFPPIILLPLAEIIIPPERQREAATADELLISSIEQRGLINPIIVHEDKTLVAGERRLDAFRKLSDKGAAYSKFNFIPARIFEQLPPVAAFEVELMENIARKQLTWQEEVRAIGKYHKMREEAFSGWTQMGTASALGMSRTDVSKKLTVAAEIDDKDVAGCPTLGGAFNLISARSDRARIAAQSRGLTVAGITAVSLPPQLPADATPAQRTEALLAHVKIEQTVGNTVDEIDKAIQNIHEGKLAAAALEQARTQEIVNDLILAADFLDWAPDYSGPKFDVLHVDFPYGKGYSGARTRKTGKVHIAPVYLDDPDIYFSLVAGLIAVQDRLAFPAAHCIFWFDMQYYQWTIEQFQAGGWTLIQPFPFIWSKGYQGVASDPRRRPRHVYETALLFSRGDRKLVKLDKDHFDCGVDEKLHLNQKPNEMLKHLLSMFVDEHTAVLDPTCGSGSALAAAAQLKAARILGVELDPDNAEVARFLLQRWMPKKDQADAADEGK